MDSLGASRWYASSKLTTSEVLDWIEAQYGKPWPNVADLVTLSENGLRLLDENVQLMVELSPCKRITLDHSAHVLIDGRLVLIGRCEWAGFAFCLDPSDWAWCASPAHGSH